MYHTFCIRFGGLKALFSNFTSTFILMLAFGSFFIAFDKEAQASISCPVNKFIQVTDEPEGNSDDSVVSGDGSRITFESAANIFGNNPGDDNEIYSILVGSSSIFQLTNFPTGASSDPAINEDGSVIAFESSSIISGPNPDENDEIYLYNFSTDSFARITNSEFFSADASINDDGTKIAFQSSGDFTGQNPDENIEIFLFDTITGEFTQVSITTGVDNFSSSISGDGTLIAYQRLFSISDEFDIFLFDTTTGITTQVTSFATPDDTGANSNSPSISGDGTSLVFDSDANITGGNPDGSREIFNYDVNSGVFTQLTSQNQQFSFFNDPENNTDGTLIVFTGGISPDGEATDMLEIYLLDTRKDLLTQITDTSTSDGNSFDPSISGDGKVITFDSNANINGGNTDGNNEVYYTLCRLPLIVPTMSEWGLIAMAGVLGLIGLLVIRKRKAAV